LPGSNLPVPRQITCINVQRLWMKRKAYRPKCMQSAERHCAAGRGEGRSKTAASQTPSTERNDGKAFPPSRFAGNNAGGDRVCRRANASKSPPSWGTVTAMRKRLGMIAPSSNSVLEPVTYAMLADEPGISAHFSRFRVTEIALDAHALDQFDPSRMLPAADLLADAKVDAVAWNGTSASWLGIER